jgi:hypothetical protein
MLLALNGCEGTVAIPYTEVMVTVEPTGNSVCGLKEPEAACADALLVVTQSPATVNVRRIPAMREYFMVFCIFFSSLELCSVVHHL